MLPKTSRVRKGADWQKIHKSGSIIHSRGLVVKFKKNNLKITRYGFVIGVKVSKKATQRNLIKRRLRAIIQQNKSRIKSGYDILIICRPAIINKKQVELSQILLNLLYKVNLKND